MSYKDNPDLSYISDRLSAAAKWATNDMDADKWYEIKPDQLEVIKLLLNESYGWPVFQLSLSNDFKCVKKTLI